MISRKTKFTTRAESVVLSYILVLGIMTVLSTLLITAGSGYLQTQHESVTETQAEITVEAIASEVEEVDKIARKVDSPSTSSGSITFQSQADDLIGQYPYKVTFKEHPEPDTYQVVVSVETRQVDVVETTNITVYELNDVHTGESATGSGLTYKYTENGTLQFDDTTEICVVNDSGSYSISSDSTLDGCVLADSTISGGEDAIIYGDIESTGSSIGLNTNISVIGDAIASVDVQFNPNSTIAGDIQAGQNVQVGQDTRVGGSIIAGSDVQTGENVYIAGDIDSSNDITLGVNTTVRGNIFANSRVTTARQANIDGSITTNISNIAIGRNSTVQGELNSGSDMTIGRDSQIESNITTNSITVETRAQINATITGDTVYLQDDVVITGDVNVPDGSQLNCGVNVTINGQSCSDYKDANY